MSKTRLTRADEPYLLVRTVGAHVASASDTGRHAHHWGQFIYCASGVMTVWTQAGSWVAPPHWAVWVPPGVHHQIRFAGAAALRTLYLRDDVAAGLPSQCTVLTVSPLLRELVLRAVEIGMLDERQSTHTAMATLIVGEASVGDAPPLHLRAPTTPAAQRASELLASGVAHGAATVARQIGLSPRTLERRFLTETGLTVASWGRQARLLQSLRLLAAGERVKAVAERAGYRTPSAFVAAFRTTFGQTPARYFSCEHDPSRQGTQVR